MNYEICKGYFIVGNSPTGDAEVGSAVDLVAELDPGARIEPLELLAPERRLAELVDRRVDLLPGPMERLRLRATVG